MFITTTLFIMFIVAENKELLKKIITESENALKNGDKNNVDKTRSVSSYVQMERFRECQRLLLFGQFQKYEKEIKRMK